LRDPILWIAALASVSLPAPYFVGEATVEDLQNWSEIYGSILFLTIMLGAFALGFPSTESLDTKLFRGFIFGAIAVSLGSDLIDLILGDTLEWGLSLVYLYLAYYLLLFMAYAAEPHRTRTLKPRIWLRIVRPLGMTLLIFGVLTYLAGIPLTSAIHAGQITTWVVLPFCFAQDWALVVVGTVAYRRAKSLEASVRAADIVSQLLAFGRRQRSSPHVFDVNDEIVRLSARLAHMVGEFVEMVHLDATGPTPVKVDSAHFEQILFNLETNARDAMPKGGRITISARSVNRDPGRRAESDRVVISIRDEGTGMSKEVRSRAFEPFYTTKPIGKGTGLGLPTVFGLVQQNHGTVEIQNEEASGTTIRIEFPRSDRQVEIVESEQPSLPLDRSTAARRVLLVDDEPSVCNLVNRLLTRIGFTVIEACDGQQALRIVEEHPDSIQLLVTDIAMPGLSGIDLATKLIERNTELKTLFISGFNESAGIHARISGSMFLQKPFSISALQKALEQLDVQSAS
jgi:CheY-like chemotaxis protein/anti-sigma regulatory factor (Ser/Thr protein kinase)